MVEGFERGRGGGGYEKSRGEMMSPGLRWW